MNLVNKKALITGGSSGIGQAIALAFAAEGADILITYNTNKKGAKNTIKQIQNLGRKAFAYKINMINHNDLTHLPSKAKKILGGIDILVNNAGALSRHNDFFSIPTIELKKIININLIAPFILTREVAKIMKTQGGGSIINISSISANIASKGLAHYESSKAALNMLTKSSAAELAKYKIRVNAICPGLIETELNKAQREKQPEVWEKRVSCIPLGVSGSVNDISNFAVMLVSNKSKWITGSIINIDGGRSITHS